MVESSASDAIGVIAMGGRPDLVWIKFVRDIGFGGQSANYRSGSQWRVDPATAAGLILMDAAVRVAVQ
jgi:hypothetical protein